MVFSVSPKHRGNTLAFVPHQANNGRLMIINYELPGNAFMHTFSPPHPVAPETSRHGDGHSHTCETLNEEEEEQTGNTRSIQASSDARLI